MATYIFIKKPDTNNEYDITTVQIKVETIIVDDLLDAFEDFLKASGYVVNGKISIIKKE